MQGGIDPELPATAYFDLGSRCKQRVPEMHVHAFSPMEVMNGAARTGLSIEDFLITRPARPGSARSPGPPPRSSTTRSAGS